MSAFERISPDMTTRFVLTRHSQATRLSGSSARAASRMPSEIWSATLSGWPSVTDSDVNRNSLSANSVMRPDRLAGSLRAPLRTAAPFLALVEVDDQRHAVHAVAGAQAVLDEIRVVARYARAAVDGDREARRPRPDLGHVEHPQPVAADGRRLASLDHLAQEPVELGRRDARAHAVAERDRLAQQPRDVAPRHGAGGEHPRPRSQ